MLIDIKFFLNDADDKHILTSLKFIMTKRWKICIMECGCLSLDSRLNPNARLALQISALFQRLLLT